jgi:hypothetical protein
VRIEALTALLAAAVLTAPGPLRAQPASDDPSRVAGIWEGALETEGARLRLTLNLAVADGRLTARLDSLDRGGPAGLVQADLARSRLWLVHPASGAEFRGMVSADVEAVVGIWSQGGRSHPLTFHRRGPGEPALAHP